MALRTVRNTVLYYRRSRHGPPALHSRGFLLLRMDVFRSANPHLSIKIERPELSWHLHSQKKTIVRCEKMWSGKHPFRIRNEKVLQIQQTYNPKRLPENPRGPFFVNPAQLSRTLAGLQLYLCPPGHHRSRVKKERSVPYEFCPIQWHIVIRKPLRTILIQNALCPFCLFGSETMR